VLAAREEASPQAEAALTQLYRAYWYPLYAFVRRQGCGVHDAQDLTQGFFFHLLKRRDLASVSRKKGRFRSFLLVALKHFLVNQWERTQAMKRGGGLAFVPLDCDSAEQRLAAEPVENLGAEKLFDRGWARAVLDAVLARLSNEYSASGHARLYEALNPFLSSEGRRRPQVEVGAELGMNENSVKQAVHRLRTRYRELLREEIAHTVGHPGDIEEELRYLIEVLRE
jgi:RNA polymerase sigma-70 factor (ECF subfamily)